MATTLAPTQDPAARTCGDFLQTLLADYGPRDFAVRFWDGITWEAETGQPPKFTLVLQHAGAVRRMFTPPVQLTLAEAYFFNDFDIEGDIEAFWDVLHYLMGLRQRASLVQLLKLRWRLGKLPSGGQQSSFQAATLKGEAHSPERNRQAISYHYDISNEFYALFLDERMLYSCGYFKTENSDVHQCQLDKIDHICKKMRLKPGDRMLDVGCGWGGLVVHAAQKYGANVVGITLSTRQKEWADRVIAKAGLIDKCKIEIRDYREIPETEQFDKISAVGCMEHVGAARLPDYFRQAFKLLKPGGVFLNHGIARGGLAPRIPRPNFVDKYVFPDGQLEAISTTLRIAEQAGFEVRDVESLRDHYIRTLRFWVSRLEANAEEARKLTNDAAYRIWRLYMSGSVYGFKVGRFNLYQSLLLKPTPGASQLPLTRQDWYA
ncbi:MAG: class I SAM-dependent methyltransferase [Gemmataceae bacterium]